MAQLPFLVATSAVAALLALCLAVWVGLISPGRFAQWVGGGAWALTLGAAGPLFLGSDFHG